MNSLTKALLNAGKIKPATDSTKVNVPKKDEPLDRILTVNIKTMRTHMRNDNFNNVHTILEVYAKIIRLKPEEGKMKMNRLTLGCWQNKHPMEAVYYGDVHSIQVGDLVRCMGQLIGQTGQFKIVKIGRIDLDDEIALIKRLEAICSFELTKSPTKVKM